MRRTMLETSVAFLSDFLSWASRNIFGTYPSVIPRKLQHMDEVSMGDEHNLQCLFSPWRQDMEASNTSLCFPETNPSSEAPDTPPTRKTLWSLQSFQEPRARNQEPGGCTHASYDITLSTMHSLTSGLSVSPCECLQVCICGGQRLMSSVFLRPSPPYLWRSPI